MSIPPGNDPPPVFVSEDEEDLFAGDTEVTRGVIEILQAVLVVMSVLFLTLCSDSDLSYLDGVAKEVSELGLGHCGIGSRGRRYNPSTVRILL